jgi:hypothetical protein
MFNLQQTLYLYLTLFEVIIKQYAGFILEALAY